MTIEIVDAEKCSYGRANYLVTCDGRKRTKDNKTTPCKAAIDAENATFEEAINRTKSKCWQIKKVVGTFQHLCPDCRGKR